MSDDGEVAAPRALVVFGGQADLAWLKMLKRGYRHCFVVVEAESSIWILYNPLSHCTELGAVTGVEGAAVAGHYRGLGYCVVETYLTNPIKRSAPWRPYTCVEAVKRVLGLRARRVFTPWQLYQFLVSKNNGINSLTLGNNS